MNKFTLEIANNNKLELLKDNKAFFTLKGNKIFFISSNKNKDIIKKIDDEYKKKDSNFIKLLYFANDLDQKKRKIIITNILKYVDTDTVCIEQKRELILKFYKEEDGINILNFVRITFY